VNLNLDLKVMVLLYLDALDVLCAQLTRDLYVIAKFLFESSRRANVIDV